jgi:adenylosuccinate synthase
MANVIVVGLQWGDEGKGKVVDVLSEQFDVVARYQGGNNAGHTVVVGTERIVLHLMPSGILRKGKICLLGNGVVVDLAALNQELDQLVRLDARIEGHFFISENAHLVMPYHKILDVERDQRPSAPKIGTTGRGIGPAYVDKMARMGIRIGDLRDPASFREKLAANLAEKQAQAPADSRLHGLSADRVYAETLSDFRRVEGYLVDGSRVVNAMIHQGKRVLFEGAQGTLLDVDLGTYPYVTSSSATAGGACTGTGVSPTRIDGVIGVAKAYCTRVGEGPFPSELTEAAGEAIRERGQEFGATTGRPRRTGWFDAVAVRYAARVNAPEALALMKLDVLDPFETVRVCTAYRHRGRTLTEFPNETRALAECEPVYEEWPGWRASTAGLTSYADLPRPCRDFIGRLEALVEVEFSLISTGPERDQTIIRRGEAFKRWGLFP